MSTDTLPTEIVDIAVSTIVEELSVYLGLRPDISSADIVEGFDSLSALVVGGCYPVILHAERHLFEETDGIEAFEKELKAYARARGREWADARAAQNVA